MKSRSFSLICMVAFIVLSAVAVSFAKVSETYTVPTAAVKAEKQTPIVSDTDAVQAPAFDAVRRCRIFI